MLSIDETRALSEVHPEFEPVSGTLSTYSEHVFMLDERVVY